MKILFSGGGTLGPVTPLLAIKQTVENYHKKASFVWVGTKGGVEKELVIEHGVLFYSISSGKLRRYLSFLNFLDLFKVFIGFLESFVILWREKPHLCISAGGFVSVPVHLAAWLLSIPTWIHQQDVRVGLANKIMTPFSTKITTALEKGIIDFPGKKVEWIGNPVREEILSGDKEKAIKKFNLKKTLPTVFVFGGGTGSARLNQLLFEALSHLDKECQVLHLTGGRLQEKQFSKFENYYSFDFFTTEMKDAYAVATVVVSRGGFATLSELAALGKATVVVPKTGHQQENAQHLVEEGAILSLDENTTSGVQLAHSIKDLLKDKTKRDKMGEKLRKFLPKAEDENVISLVEELVKK